MLRLDAARPRRRRRLGDSVLGWFGLAAALSTLGYSLLYVSSAGQNASPVTAWVAGVVTTLALGLCALFVVLAHHELRRWWRPMASLAGTAVLGLALLHLA